MFVILLFLAALTLGLLVFVVGVTAAWLDLMFIVTVLVFLAFLVMVIARRPPMR